MSLPTSVNGATGKVVLLAPHQGKLTFKFGDVCFTRAVVLMPNSKPPPASLCSCIQLGDLLHFYAELTTDPVLQQPTYRAKSVWFPNSKPSSNKHADSTSSDSSNCTSEPVDKAQDKNASGGKRMVDKCIESIKNLLRSKGSMHFSKLHELLQTTCDEDVRKFIISVNAVRSFLDIHANEFLVRSDGVVFAIEHPVEKPSRTSPNSGFQNFRSKSEKTSSDTKTGQMPQKKQVSQPTENARASCRKYFKDVLKSQGPLTPAEFVDWLNLAPAEVLNYVGRSADAIVAYLLREKNIFTILENGKIIYGSNKLVKNDASDLGPLPGYHRDVLVHVGNVFGFIRHGSEGVENIYVSLSSYPEADGNLMHVLKVGDVVDCLYKAADHKRNKYSAVRVWKSHSVESSKDSGIESSLLALPTVLPSAVCYGEAVVKLLSNPVGYCLLQGDADSLIELDGRNKKQSAVILFHFGHILGHKFVQPKLKKGSRIMFVAHQKQTQKESPTEYWNVISMWPSKKNSDNNAAERFSVTAEVQELTSEGGRLSFGKDPWADGISFSWEQVISNATGLHNKAVSTHVGDTFWCIVTGGHMAKGDPTKWVAVELIPCDLNIDSEPPSRFTACPAVPLMHELKSASGKISETSQNPPEQNAPIERIASPASSESYLSANGDELLMDLGSPDASVVMVDGSAKVVSKDNYGGVLESESGDALKFDAHAFFYNGKPVSHLAFPEGTRVHYDGCSKGGELVATMIWIGKRPGQDGKRGVSS